MKILDIGTGYGGTSIPLACMGYEVTATDLDLTMLNVAERNSELFENLLLKPMRFEQADTFDLHRYYGEFDIVLSDGVLEHFTPDKR